MSQSQNPPLQELASHMDKHDSAFTQTRQLLQRRALLPVGGKAVEEQQEGPSGSPRATFKHGSLHTGGAECRHLLAADDFRRGLVESRSNVFSDLVQRLHLQQRPALEELPEVPLLQAPACKSIHPSYINILTARQWCRRLDRGSCRQLLTAVHPLGLRLGYLWLSWVM